MREGVSCWRAKIGVLSPNPLINLTCEWTGFLPEGVTFHEAVMSLSAVTPDGLKQMRNNEVAEARKLTEGIMDIILFACTSGSFIGGPGYDKGIIEELEAATGIPVTTTTTCILTAFADLGVKKIALIGPYTDEVLDVEVNFFKEHGIDTRYVKGLGESDINFYVRMPEQPYLFYHMAKEAYRSAPDVDAIFITCTASPARKIVNTLELETGKPVISSCLASFYGVMKQLGIKEPIEEFGRMGRLLGERL
jgi:maleate isomerase